MKHAQVNVHDDTLPLPLVGRGHVTPDYAHFQWYLYNQWTVFRGCHRQPLYCFHNAISRMASGHGYIYYIYHLCKLQRVTTTSAGRVFVLVVGMKKTSHGLLLLFSIFYVFLFYCKCHQICPEFTSRTYLFHY